MPHPVGKLHPQRRRRNQPGRQHHVAGAIRHGAAGPVGGHHIQQGNIRTVVHRADVDHPATVRDRMRDPPGRPFQIVVELPARREQRLVVDERHEPALDVQVRHEAEVAGGIAECDQVLEKSDLHRRVVNLEI